MPNPAPPTTKRTPLYEEHVKLKARMADFGGWLMPISYDGVLSEHKAVREKAGLFDVSHMGEIRVQGPDAENFLQYLTINDVSRLTPGASQYSAILNERAGFIDDLLVYRLAAEEFLLCVNAANIEKDFQWILSVGEDFRVEISNDSSAYAQIAVQGPQSRAALRTILSPAAQEALDDLPYTRFFTTDVFKSKAIIARTGYTGELGYEIYLPNDTAVATWRALLATSGQTGIVPIGLGARDTLRLEACYLLYGNEMDDGVTPFEAGVSWAVRMNCGEFIGKEALDEHKVAGIKRTLQAFKMIDQGIARHGMDVYLGDECIGKVTSGSVLPTVGGAGGMALLDADKTQIGDKVTVDVRGRRRLACVVERPLYPAKVKS